MLGSLLPLATIALFILAAINQSTPNPTEIEGIFLCYLLALGAWIVGLIMESVVSRIAGKILKRK